MRSTILLTAAAGLVALIVACSGSESTPETTKNPTTPGTSGGNASGGTSGTSGSTNTSSGASGASGSSGTSGVTPQDAGKEGGNADGTCGKPGDVGNSKGVGKYCTSIIECLGNKDAQLCATAGDEKATFCTKLCKKGD